MTTNYFAKQLHASIGDEVDREIHVRHVEEKSPLGTAGSVKNSESFVDDTFVVIQGDNQFTFGLDEIVNHHRKLGAIATIAVIGVENPSEYGIVELSDGRVNRFLEKPAPQQCFSDLINTGIYVLEPEALRLIPKGRSFDFSRDLFPLMLKSKEVLAGSLVSGFWIDMGNPRNYLKANFWALDSIERNTPEKKSDAVFGSGGMIPDVTSIKGPVHLGQNVRIEEGAVVGPYVCIEDDSEISADARVSFSVIYENTRIGAGAVLNSCIVAEHCKIGDRVQIDRDTVVGAGTELGNASHLMAESRVGPFVVVQPNRVVEGTVTAFEGDIERICGFLEKSRVGFGLTNEEARVCGTLCELGEADARTVTRFAHISYSEALAILDGFRERGIAISFGTTPKMYALTQEEGEDVSDTA